MSTYLNADCMNKKTGLPSYPDKHFDWCIADPNYGIKEHGGKKRSGWAKQPNGSKLWVNDGGYEKKQWDEKPCSPRVLNEIMRVSKNQIIFGINYLKWTPPSCGRIVWDKVNEGTDQSDCEIAFCSAHETVRIFRFMWSGFCQGSSAKSGTVQKGDKSKNQDRFHPTEKPYEFYRWAAAKYLKVGDTICDPFVGSASSLVVFEELGFDYVAFETDKDYYRDSTARLEKFRRQGSLFTGREIFEASRQVSIFDQP